MKTRRVPTVLSEPRWNGERVRCDDISDKQLCFVCFFSLSVSAQKMEISRSDFNGEQRHFSGRGDISLQTLRRQKWIKWNGVNWNVEKHRVGFFWKPILLQIILFPQNTIFSFASRSIYLTIYLSHFQRNRAIQRSKGCSKVRHKLLL